jgi:hypothetical protein
VDFLYREFQKFPDHRAGNALQYDLADVLKSAFAMFSLKAFSTIVFRNRLLTRAVQYRDREGAAEHASRNYIKALSLLDFKKRTEPERNNLRSIYRIRGAIPRDNRVTSVGRRAFEKKV